MKRFDELGGFRSRGCAHVQNFVVRLHIQDQRWDHRDGLLTTDVAWKKSRGTFQTFPRLVFAKCPFSSCGIRNTILNLSWVCILCLLIITKRLLAASLKLNVKFKNDKYLSLVGVNYILFHLDYLVPDPFHAIFKNVWVSQIVSQMIRQIFPQVHKSRMTAWHDRTTWPQTRKPTTSDKCLDPRQQLTWFSFRNEKAVQLEVKQARI